MNFLPKNKVQTHKNSERCIAHEYHLGDVDINGAVVELFGRYPAQGRVTNTICKELVYIISGSGKIVVEGKEIKLQQGDQILILPKEKYYWEGTMMLFIACTPSWHSEHHKKVI